MKKYSRWNVPTDFCIEDVIICDNNEKLRHWVRCNKRSKNYLIDRELVDFYTNMNNKPYTGKVILRKNGCSAYVCIEKGWLHNDTGYAWKYLDFIGAGTLDYYSNGKYLGRMENYKTIMNSVLDETLEVLWYVDIDGLQYVLVKNLIGEIKLFRDDDIEEAAYKVFCLRPNYKVLSGQFITIGHYIWVEENKLHNEEQPALRCPDIVMAAITNKYSAAEKEYFFLYGRIMTKKQWITWMKGKPNYYKALAYILASTNNER